MWYRGAMNARFAVPLLVLLLTLLVIPTAGAHTNEDHAVLDNNGQAVLVYENNMRYGYDSYGQYAVRKWRELNGPGEGGVRIRHASKTNLPTTLEFYTYYNCKGVAEYYDPRPNPDRVYLNRCELANNSTLQRKQVAMHGLGHALDFEHPPETGRYARTSIMYTQWGSLERPGSHDRKDYKSRWGL